MGFNNNIIVAWMSGTANTGGKLQVYPISFFHYVCIGLCAIAPSTTLSGNVSAKQSIGLTSTTFPYKDSTLSFTATLIGF